MPFEPGQLIHGRYEIIRLIGAGGVGFVVAARHSGFDDLVALKFLRPEYATNAEAVSRFTNEARACFKLRSEHVVRVLDVDIYEETPFIAMELLEGVDLRSVLDRDRILDIEPAVDYTLQVCEALSAAHGLGVIHRDIKPENLFLLGSGDERDHLKVLDFGISKVALVSNGRSTNQAWTRIAVGTPPYMSPEQVRASRTLDARSDLWSVGCVLYEMLTGTAPFDRGSLMQSCAAVLEENPPAPRQLRPSIPPALSDAILRCLSKTPDGRYSDVADLADALGPFGSERCGAYPSRCRAQLNGEGPGRRSTPSSLSISGVRITSSVPVGATQQSLVELAASEGVTAAKPPERIQLRSVPMPRTPTVVSGGYRQPTGEIAAVKTRRTPTVTSPPPPPPKRAAPTASTNVVALVPSKADLVPLVPGDADEAAMLGSARRRNRRMVVVGILLVLGGASVAYSLTHESQARIISTPLSVAPVHSNVSPASDIPEAASAPASDTRAFIQGQTQAQAPAAAAPTPAAPPTTPTTPELSAPVAAAPSADDNAAPKALPAQLAKPGKAKRSDSPIKTANAVAGDPDVGF